jgi:5-methylcytosine-specific restriction endonuclease McrA
VSSSSRRKLINARFRWILKKMNLSPTLERELAVNLIANYLKVPLIGRNLAKKKKYLSKEIAKLSDCPFDPVSGKTNQWTAQKVKPTNIKCSNPNLPTEKMISNFYKSWEWKRLSYDVKLKLGRKCMCCGGTPETGAVINTDHIKPLRKNWHLRLDKTNMQILCNDCNMGKGSRDETDFRPSDDVTLRMSLIEEQLTQH